MAKDNSISQDLADLLVTKNFDPVYTDATGRDSSPGEAVVFSFDYVAGSGKNYGTVVIVLGDDNDLQMFFGDNLGKSIEDQQDKDDWFQFLEQMSDFSTQHRYTWNLKDINQLKHTMAGIAAIKEGLFEGYYGTRKISYMGEVTDARLVIKHKKALEENDRRHLYVESLFIETADGERFKLPFRKLSGGRAMLEHVRQGGKPYDIRGCHIVEMVNEMAVLARFNRASLGRVFEGHTQELVESAQNYYHSLQENLKHMATHRGYKDYFESWSPADVGSEDALVEDIKTLFVEQSIDARIEAALPTLAKLQQRGQVMKEAEIFENWINNLAEGTWALPDTPEQQAKLQELMSQELVAGPDGTNATEQLYDLVGDDQLFDLISAAADADPNGNIWDNAEIVDRLAELGVDTSAISQRGAEETPEPEQGVAEGSLAEGSLAEGQYEMMFSNGKVKKFVAKDDADAKRIAAGHGAKSVIRLKGGVPAGKVSEQGVAEGSTTRGGFGGSAGQAQHEIQWLQNKIETLKPLLAKKPSVARQIKDLERQIRERELAIAYQKQGVAENSNDTTEIAQELDDVLSQGVDYVKAVKLIAKKYNTHPEYVVRAYEEWGNFEHDDTFDLREQGVAEMDKSQPSHGRDGHVSHSTYGSRDKGGSQGQDRTARATTADKMMKDAHDAMMKSMSAADKVKKGWRNPKMKEGLGQDIDYTSLEVDGIHSWDSPDYSDAYFSYGEYIDGTPLPDDVLDQLSSNGELLHKHIQNKLYEADTVNSFAECGTVAGGMAPVQGALEESWEDNPVVSAIIRRIVNQRIDLLQDYGPAAVTQAIETVANYVGDFVSHNDEIGTSDVSGWVKQVEQSLKGELEEGIWGQAKQDPMNYNAAITGSYYESKDDALARLKSLALSK